MDNTTKRSIVLVSLFVFVFTSLAQAGLIDYERRARMKNRRKKVTTAAPVAKKVEKVKKVKKVRKVSDKDEKICKILQSEPKPATRMERLYDENRDRKLQEKEIQSFLKDIMSAVERRGSFSARSKFLKPFDKDSNGIIEIQELAEVRKYVK